jgi:hypothetical protein
MDLLALYPLGECAQNIHWIVDLGSVHIQSDRKLKTETKLRGLSKRANYTDLAIAACRRS